MAKKEQLLTHGELTAAFERLKEFLTWHQMPDFLHTDLFVVSMYGHAGLLLVELLPSIRDAITLPIGQDARDQVLKQIDVILANSDKPGELMHRLRPRE